MTRPTRRHRRGALLASLTAAAGAVLIAAPAALATFPGANGAIAFERGGDIWAVNPDGSGERPITTGATHDDSAPRWSPDGRQLVFQRQGADGAHIYTINADGTGLKWIRQAHSPAWSPDGKRIAFISGNDGVFAMNRDGTGVKQVAPVEFDAVANPDWAPKTDLIGFDILHDAFEHIDAASLGGVSLNFGIFKDRPAEAEELVVENISWSPDGTRIAARFSPSLVHGCGPTSQEACPEDPTVGLTTMTLGGTEQSVIVREGRAPAWSPDGARIAYVTGGFPGPAEVWVAGIDGSGKRKLTVGSAPDWQPLAPAPPQPPPPPPPTVTRTVTVTVQAPPPPPVVVEKVITRTVQGGREKCVIPVGKRKLTLTIRATRAIKKGAAVKVTVDLAKRKAKVPRGKPYRVTVR